MSKKQILSQANEILEQIKILLAGTTADSLTGPARKNLVKRVDAMRQSLDMLTRKIDPNEMPDAFFDPNEPSLMGNFVALALVAQDRKPLATLPRFYGSGVYAIYYTGSSTLYSPISGSETPIYVGKVDPPKGNPKTPTEQGTKLADRLREHSRNIEKVSGIELEDFECRALAVQSGFQSAAESHLISLFSPIWNSETRILYGLGKHGDSSTTRANNKSPFDTIHPGRKWATGNPEAKTINQIEKDVSTHFSNSKVFNDVNSVFSAFIENLRFEKTPTL